MRGCGGGVKGGLERSGWPVGEAGVPGTVSREVTEVSRGSESTFSTPSRQAFPAESTSKRPCEVRSGRKRRWMKPGNALKQFPQEFPEGKATGQMDPEAAGTLAQASTDLEQPTADGLHRSRGQLRPLQEHPIRCQQVVGQGGQEQPEGVGQEAMATEPITGQVILELADVALGGAPVVVEGKEVSGQARQVGDDEASIAPLGVDLHLVEDAARSLPGARLIEKASDPLVRLTIPVEALLEPLQGPLSLLLEGRVGGKADKVADPVALTEAIELRSGKAGIGPDDDLYLRKGPTQLPDYGPQQCLASRTAFRGWR